VPFQPNKANVTNVVDALKAVTAVSTEIQAPAWLSESAGLPPTNELFPLENDAVHLPSGDLIDPTPNLFKLHSADWSYDLEQPEPVEWVKFLKSIWPDDAMSAATLQEWFGYRLTSDFKFSLRPARRHAWVQIFHRLTK
jgi:putative DNA primase/helicase